MLHKDSQIKEIHHDKHMEMKDIYNYHARIYLDKDHNEINYRILDAIDRGKTHCTIFHEKEQEDISLFDDDIIRTFNQGFIDQTGKHGISLRNLLLSRLSKEFDIFCIIDRNKPDGTIIKFKLRWNVVLETEKERENRISISKRKRTNEKERTPKNNKKTKKTTSVFN